MRLVINLDDLGSGKPVNAAIFDLLLRGKARSASLIANAPAADDALSRLSEFPQCSFGVHLNLTQFEPLTDPIALQPLLGSDGQFDAKALRSTPLRRPLRRAIFAEWAAQIRRFLSAGHRPSHLDSHHHAHTIPALFFVLKQTQRQFGIRHVRITKNIYGPQYPVSRELLLRKRLWNLSLRYWYPTQTTNGFTSLSEFHYLVEKGELERSIRLGDNGIIELMVHPGNSGFANETRLLESDLTGAANWKLASYRDF